MWEWPRREGVALRGVTGGGAPWALDWGTLERGDQTMPWPGEGSLEELVKVYRHGKTAVWVYVLAGSCGCVCVCVRMWQALVGPVPAGYMRYFRQR